MPHSLSVGETYRRRILSELWKLLDLQDRQLPRLRLRGEASVLAAAEHLRNKTVNLIQRLLAEPDSPR